MSHFRRVGDSYIIEDDDDEADSFLMEDGLPLAPFLPSPQRKGGSAGSSSIASPTAEALGGSSSSERLSTMVLLHGALSALSLTDKCALSLSLGGTGTDSRAPLSDDFEVTCRADPACVCE
jgi:hypothetical protein